MSSFVARAEKTNSTAPSPARARLGEDPRRGVERGGHHGLPGPAARPDAARAAPPR